MTQEQKLMRMNKTLLPWGGIDRLFSQYATRTPHQEEGRGLVSIEYCGDATIQGLVEYTKKRVKKDWLQQPVTPISTELT